MNNLHVVMNPFRFASRILKETASLVRSGRVDHVYIAAFHEKGLAGFERIDDAREVWRARLRSRELPRVFFAQVFKYLEYCAKVFSTHGARASDSSTSIRWTCSRWACS